MFVRDIDAATYILQTEWPHFGRGHGSHLDHYSGPVWVIQYNTVYRLLSRIVIVPLGTYSSVP